MQEPSSRAYEKVVIQCGLLTIQSEIFSGMAAKSGVSRKMFAGPQGDHEVGYVYVDKVTGEVVAGSEIVKKVDTPAGFVFVGDGEVETLFNLYPKSVTVKSFHPMKLWGQGMVTDKLYFVEPTKTSRKVGGKTVKTVDASSRMTLSLLLESMAKEKVFALVEWVSRGVPKPAVLTSDGQLWTVHFENDLRKQRPLDLAELPATTIKQARALVKAMVSTEGVPPQVDEYTAKIQAFADEKAAAGDFTQPVDVVTAAPAATIFDIEEMLRASVQQAS